jgi:arylsulfatase
VAQVVLHLELRIGDGVANLVRELQPVEEQIVERVFLLVPAQQYVGGFLSTFKEFPPSQKVGSFSLDQVLQSLQQGGK